MSAREEPPSPCNGICTIDAPTGLCVGCGRSREEIGQWIAMTHAERATLLALLPARLASLRATDPMESDRSL